MKTLITSLLACTVLMFVSCKKQEIEPKSIVENNPPAKYTEEYHGKWNGGALQSYDEATGMYLQTTPLFTSVEVTKDSVYYHYVSGVVAGFTYQVMANNCVLPEADTSNVVIKMYSNGNGESTWVIRVYKIGSTTYCEWKSCCNPTAMWIYNDKLSFTKQ
jgi:hypothetical protein